MICIDFFSKRFLIPIIVSALLNGSSHAATKNIENVCQVFLDNPRWLWAASEAQQRWQVPISLMMAVIFQESHFVKDAEPPRKKLFNLIPWVRPTTAEGYPQATDDTWHLYCKNRKRVSASRNSFSDAVDFIGWYISYAHGKLRIAKTDAYAGYLAYHEGIQGYATKSFNHKFWLKHVARNVQQRAMRYHQQLAQCQPRLPVRPWWY
ncbi:MAG: hypothetical protein A3F17_09115 [Gammaproteobacteria bacterium RIFCSPHIGHO2_12_FULL_41_15]|nr:MAG: hypothetical protein A3F17_09115 [Gammaproteobacteria bacterium RIFCSPHIGHO2_12_FULL_41_15]